MVQEVHYFRMMNGVKVPQVAYADSRGYQMQPPRELLPAPVLYSTEEVGYEMPSAGTMDPFTPSDTGTTPTQDNWGPPNYLAPWPQTPATPTPSRLYGSYMPGNSDQNLFSSSPLVAPITPAGMGMGNEDVFTSSPVVGPGSTASMRSGGQDVLQVQTPQQPRQVSKAEQSRVVLEADPKNPNWTYAVEAFPVTDDDPNDPAGPVRTHTENVQQALTKKMIPYRFTVEAPLDGSGGLCRRYTLPSKHRGNDRMRLDFMQVFNTNRPHNNALVHYGYEMIVVYDGGVTAIAAQSFASNPIIGNDHGMNGRNDGNDAEYAMSVVHTLQRSLGGATAMPPSPALSDPFGSSPVGPPSSIPKRLFTEGNGRRRLRSKPIAKPVREETKNADGNWICTVPNCTEGKGPKVWDQKGKWDKHMDKHERPYKCATQGCEALPGFTYSGGLLRHEREVHGKHGGPKNPMSCPHVGCKRHFPDNGFSRLENLNEHIRRVHPGRPGSVAALDDDDDEEPEVENADLGASPRGKKRKADNENLRDEVKRLQTENGDLRSKIGGMMRQMQQLQQRDSFSAPAQACYPRDFFKI
ncbi:Uu.00g100110.m01.CDS01 [Anthostomella pinea]|uniref:Uu.00g100110.m01.CDS01 n=1 Tax=Anthostomella pinea TaxID=933095 RepID=A0AAI8VDX9_9PEZI|nr:Uu.00g100110.m01.CDS01 [Anthostomella pinea]